MATPNPNEFDYFNRGEVYEGQRGQTQGGEFDYWSRGEVDSTPDSFSTAIAGQVVPWVIDYGN